MNTSWHSYPKIWALGHAGVAELLFDSVIVEEKIDGSQFSFGLFGTEIKIRSKGQEMIFGKEKMFSKAEDFVQSVADRLHEGWTYRAEYLQKPKHNVLAYDRVPAGNLILFDINSGHEQYLSPEAKAEEAARLGLETVPLLHNGKIDAIDTFRVLLDRISCLGGQKVEGFVVKNYARFGADKKALMGKYVSEAFKEKHKVDWKESNPAQNDILLRLINAYRTGARWDKAIIHLKEAGKLENSPRDIGLLIKEVGADMLFECGDEIKALLWQWAQPNIMRGLIRGLPEYYKEKLLASQPLAPAEQLLDGHTPEKTE